MQRFEALREETHLAARRAGAPLAALDAIGDAETLEDLEAALHFHGFAHLLLWWDRRMHHHEAEKS